MNLSERCPVCCECAVQYEAHRECATKDRQDPMRPDGRLVWFEVVRQTMKWVCAHGHLWSDMWIAEGP